MKKAAQYFKPFGISLLVIGAGMALIGLYYSLVRAGVPAQDATLDLQMEYLVNMRVGGVLFWYGLVVIAAGIMNLLFSRLAAARK